MASTITQLITFEFLLIIFLGAYGVSVGGVDISTTMSQITGNWPIVGTGKCSFGIGGPTGSCNVLDTVELGGIWIISAFGSVLYRVGASLFLIYQLVSVLSLVTSIPYFGPLFIGFQVILGLYGYSLIRANHPNLG